MIRDGAQADSLTPVILAELKKVLQTSGGGYFLIPAGPADGINAASASRPMTAIGYTLSFAST